MNVAGKVVVVTGAASGIGRALARRFAAEGAARWCAPIATATGRARSRTRSPAAHGSAVRALAERLDVGVEAEVAGARRAHRARRRPDRPVLLERRHPGAGRRRDAERGLAAHLVDQRDGARLRGARAGAAHARARRRLPAQHRVGGGAAEPDRLGAVRRHQARRGRRSPSGCRSRTGRRGSRSRCCARRRCARR